MPTAMAAVAFRTLCLAGNVELEFAERLIFALVIFVLDLKAAERPIFFPTRFRGDDLHSEIRFRAGAIGRDTTLYTWQQRAEGSIVSAGNDHAIKRHAIHELDEGLFHILHVAIAIHVLAVDVGDDGKNWGQLEERPVALVGFGDEVLRLTEAGIGAHSIDATADDDRGIEAACGKHRRNHGSGGGFAVHARDGDAVLQPHEFGQHFGALDDGDMQAGRFGNFWIVANDGGTGDHNIG